MILLKIKVYLRRKIQVIGFYSFWYVSLNFTLFVGKPAASKGNGNDNVESIDMEMSDEDQEDPNRDLFEGKN